VLCVHESPRQSLSRPVSPRAVRRPWRYGLRDLEAGCQLGREQTGREERDQLVKGQEPVAAGRDFKAGQLPAGENGATGEQGPTGATGAAGSDGEPGSALVLSYVEDLGTSVNVDPARLKGLCGSMVSGPQTGLYCFELSSLRAVRNVAVTARSSFNSVTETDKTAAAQLQQDSEFGLDCPTDSDLVVTRHLSEAAATGWFFYGTLN
jgi:hypothetical protein